MYNNRAPRVKKSKKMLEVEATLDEPLEDKLPQMINDAGLTETAKKLGVSKATLGYWLLKFGITVHRVALRPNETIKVVSDRGQGDVRTKTMSNNRGTWSSS